MHYAKQTVILTSYADSKLHEGDNQGTNERFPAPGQSHSIIRFIAI